MLAIREDGMSLDGRALRNADSIRLVSVGAVYPVLLRMSDALRYLCANPSEPGGWVVLPLGEADLTSFRILSLST